MLSEVKLGPYEMKQMIRPNRIQQYVYVKPYLTQHSKKAAAEESIFVPDRTLMVVNVPNDMTPGDMERIFAQFGAIQHLDASRTMGHGPMAPNTVRIVYKDAAAMARALTASRYSCAETDRESEECVGWKFYEEQYMKERPGLTVLKEEADRYMAEYALRETQELEERQVASEQVDADGFQKVVSVGKKRGSGEMMSLKQRKKKKSKELTNFYRFQMREQLKALRLKFEQDKARIEEMKRARMFQPEL